MYQALYRKWRPQSFDDVVGQQHITNTLRNQVMNDRLSHAYIFIGTRGTGKTTCARILAKAANCDNPVNGNPCCRCAACRTIADGTAIDVVEIDAASNNSVENIRQLRDEASFSPAVLRKRVYIIDEVHMLSMSAFNALLKIIEEPPEHLMFVLATTELQKVPATILSRCQRHSFKRIESNDITVQLMKIASAENMNLSEDAARLIAGLSEGGLRDALTLLDQCSSYVNIGVDEVYNVTGLAGNRIMLSLFTDIAKHDASSAVSAFNKLWIDGKDPASVIKELGELIRDVLVAKVVPKGFGALVHGGYEHKELANSAALFTTEELTYMLLTVQSSADSMRGQLNPKTTAELCIVSLCNNRLGDSISALKARISALENAVAGGVKLSIAAEQDNEFTAEAESAADLNKAADVNERNEVTFDNVSEPERCYPVAEARIPTEECAAAVGEKVTWQAVCNAVKGNVSRDVATYLFNPTVMTGVIEDKALRIFVSPGFTYGRVNKPAVLSAFADAVKTLTGNDVRVVLSELKDSSRQSRDIEELRKFPEVKFI